MYLIYFCLGSHERDEQFLNLILGAQMVGALYMQSKTVHSFAVHVIGNWSVHNIDHRVFDNVFTIALPPNMTRRLQSLDCASGRSFRCTVRRLFCLLVSSYVIKQLAEKEESPRLLTISEVANLYSSINIIKNALDLVSWRLSLRCVLRVE